MFVSFFCVHSYSLSIPNMLGQKMSWEKKPKDIKPIFFRKGVKKYQVKECLENKSKYVRSEIHFQKINVMQMKSHPILGRKISCNKKYSNYQVKKVKK